MKTKTEAATNLCHSLASVGNCICSGRGNSVEELAFETLCGSFLLFSRALVTQTGLFKVISQIAARRII